VVGSGVVRGGVVGSGLGVVRSGSWVVNGSGLGVVGSGFGVVRSGSGVVGSGFGVVRLVMGLSFVFDISDVSVFVVSSVSHNLGTTIRKGNAVFAMHNTVVILSFLLAEIGAGVFILDSVFVGERPGGQLVFGGGVVGSGLVNWGVVRSGLGGVIGGGSGVVWSGSGVVRSGMVGSVVGNSQSHRGQH